MGKIAPKKEFDLEYFFDIAPDLLCIAGFDGYFKKINPAVSRTLGYSQQELMASPIDTFVHPDDRKITAQRRSTLTQGHSLMNFENRYLARDGSVVWLSWTSVPIKGQGLVFAIAKNVTYRKQLEEYDRISSILGMITDDHQKRFKRPSKIPRATALHPPGENNREEVQEPTQSDQRWLNSFEAIVRENAANPGLNLNLVAGELALSQRQLFRRVDRVLGITPNKLVRIIRLQIAWEAIASGRYRTIKEISSIAGFNSRSHFSSLFKEVYGINAGDLL